MTPGFLEKMKREEALIVLAKALTGESWSTGLGGFDSWVDRVSRRGIVRRSVATSTYSTRAGSEQSWNAWLRKRPRSSDLAAVPAFLEAVTILERGGTLGVTTAHRRYAARF